jgi:RNA polymerase sigma factor (sigma-70 family)
MHEYTGAGAMTAEQDRRLSADIARERPRLRNFIRKRVANDADVEDILQDVFSELVEAYRLMEPVGQVSAWLFRVARNRMVDLFRKRKTEAISEVPQDDADEDEAFRIDELLPSAEAGPEADHARQMLLEALEDALSELPAQQRDVFIAHEIEGKSFKQLATETGLSVNTLLSRKHYAVRALRERLQDIYDEFNET